MPSRELRNIGTIFKRLVADIKWTAHGVTWKPGDLPLAELKFFGLSAAGVGLFFTELARISDNKVFLFLFDQVRIFEDSEWVDEFANWGDFCKPINSIEDHHLHLRKFEAGDHEFFTIPVDNLVKTYEICAARLNAWQLTNETKYHVDYLKGQQKLRCSGKQVNVDHKLDGIRRQSASELGTAITSSVHDVKIAMINSCFSRTLAVLNAVCPEKILEYTEQLDFSQAGFTSTVRELIPTLTEKHSQCLEDILHYEEKIIEVNNRCGSRAFSHVKNIRRQINADKLLSLSDPDFWEATVQRAGEICEIDTLWNWTSFDAQTVGININQSADSHAVLLMPWEQDNVKEFLMPEMRLFILSIFEKPISIKNATSISLESITLEDITEDRAKEYFMTEICTCISRCLIVDAG